MRILSSLNSQRMRITFPVCKGYEWCPITNFSGYLLILQLPETSTGHTDLQLQVRGEGEVRVEVVCAYNSLRATPVCPLSLTGRAESRHFLTAQSPW